MEKLKLNGLENYQTPQMSEIDLSTEQTILTTSTSGIGFDFGGGFGTESPLD